MAIYITGDTHGVQERILEIEKQTGIGSGDYLLVCGDFGYLMLNDLNENYFLDDLSSREYTILFVDGNHECFPAIFSYKKELWNGGYVHEIRKNIFHLMRGQIYTIEGKSFFTLGGAYSIDRYMRKLGYSYWEEEMVSDSEYKEAIKNLTAHNNKVDYIITHTAPREIIMRMGKNPDLHDMELTGFLEYLMYEIDFNHWYCGHWHMDKEITDKFTALFFDYRVIG